MVYKLLLIDDDVEIAAQINQILTTNGFLVTMANTPQQALDALVERYDYILCDYAMGNMDVSAFLCQLKEIQPQAILLLLSGFNGLKYCASLGQSGVSDVVIKPISTEEILAVIHQSKVKESTQKITAKDVSLITSEFNESDFTDWVGYSSTQTPETLLDKFNQQLNALWDETNALLLMHPPHAGAGNFIYNLAKNDTQTSGNFVHVNCKAMLPENMFKHLFGYEKGAFTGAFAATPGVLEQSLGGVVVLNGIENLSNEAQIAIVTAYEKGFFTRIGGTNQLPLNFKFIATTNLTLGEDDLRSLLRQDFFKLFKRLEQNIPTLAQRKKDILPNAILLLQRIKTKYGLQAETIGDEAAKYLFSYNWPGNWHELYLTLRRAAFLCDESYINTPDLPLQLTHQNRFNTTSQAQVTLPKNAEFDIFSANQIAKINEQVPKLKAIAAEAELETINRVLHSVKFNKTKAAKILGVDRKTLYNKMMKHKIVKLSDKN